MATDTTDKVQDKGADVSDVDFNEVAANLGVQFKTPGPAKTEEKPAEETTEPDATADDTDPAQAEPAETENDEEDPDTDPEETAGDGEGEQDAEDQPGPESKDEEPTKVQKRIDRLTAEKHELREERDVIKAELEALRQQAESKPPVVTVDPENPLSSFTDAAALEAEINKAQAVLDWADDNRDGGSVTVNGEEKFYDADAVKQIKANAKSLLRAAPKQKEYLQIREQALPEAKAMYPELFQPGTVPKAYLDASLKAYPWLTRFPGYELIIGDAFVGQNMREARLKQQQRKQSSSKATKSPAAAAKVPKTPSPAASPKVSGSEAALRRKAEAVFKSGGNPEALTDYLEAIV